LSDINVRSESRAVTVALRRPACSGGIHFVFNGAARGGFRAGGDRQWRCVWGTEGIFWPIANFEFGVELETTWTRNADVLPVETNQVGWTVVIVPSDGILLASTWIKKSSIEFLLNKFYWINQRHWKVYLTLQCLKRSFARTRRGSRWKWYWFGGSPFNNRKSKRSLLIWNSTAEVGFHGWNFYTFKMRSMILGGRCIVGLGGSGRIIGVLHYSLAEFDWLMRRLGFFIHLHQISNLTCLLVILHRICHQATGIKIWQNVHLKKWAAQNF